MSTLRKIRWGRANVCKERPCIAYILIIVIDTSVNITKSELLLVRQLKEILHLFDNITFV